MGAELYVAAFVAFAAAIAAPAFLHDVGPRARRFVVQTAFLVASVAAYLAATNYSEFLLGGKGFTFDETDPVFGRDIGFYAFDLPNIWIAWRYLTWAAFAFLAVSVACANASRARRSATIPSSGLRARLATSATRTARAAWILLGILVAAGVWLTRYDLLLKNNSDASTIKRGAQYLDVVGFFSNLTYITVTTLRRPRLHAGDRVVAEAAARPDAGPAAASASFSPARSRSRSSSPISRSRAPSSSGTGSSSSPTSP